MKKLLFLSLIFLCLTLPVTALPLVELGADGTDIYINTVQTVGTSPVVSVPMSNARHIIILNNSVSNTVYFTLDGSTPSSSNFNLGPSLAISLDGLPATATLKLLASGASTSVSILGW